MSSKQSQSQSDDRNVGSRGKAKKHHRQRQTPTQKIYQFSQSKITHFFRNVNNSQKISPKPSQVLLKQLQLELERLNEEEEYLQTKKYQLNEEHRKYLREVSEVEERQKCLMKRCLKERYELKRALKGEIDGTKGFFLDKTSNFIEGDAGLQITQKIQSLKRQISKCDDERRKNILINCLDVQEKKRNHFQIELENYKQRLINAYEESNCMFNGQWPLLAERYQVLELIGKGGFSQVYKAFDLEEGKYVAIKFSSFKGVAQNISHYVLRQYDNHKMLSHQNIAQLYDIIDMGAEGICIAMQLCQGPELCRFMKNKGKVEEVEAKTIVFQILKAIHYLNSGQQKIIHYDLKPQNIIFSEGSVKILDFGLSKQIDNEHSKIALTTYAVGTYWYLPPQSFKEKNSKVSGKVDIWSVGVIFYEMLYACKPFGNEMSQKNIISSGVILNAPQVEFPQSPEVSKEAKKFIKDCLAYNPQDRLDPLKAIYHSYFTE